METTTDASAITVVIPVRDRAAIVADTLDSVARQRPLPAKLILVDNGSTDSTEAAMRSWAAAHASCGMEIAVISEKKAGAAAARNAGLAAADSDWVMFFDSDDIMLPGHMARAAAAIKAHPGARIIGWDVEYLPLSGKRRTLPFADTDMLYNCVLHGTMATQRYMARRELFAKAGGWDADVMAWNDIELGVRLIATLHCPAAEVAYAKGAPTARVIAREASITGTSYSSRSQAYGHALARIEASLPERSRWIAALKRAVLAGLYGREGQRELAADMLRSATAIRGCAPWMCRLAAWQASKGLPGASRIIRIFMPR